MTVRWPDTQTGRSDTAPSAERGFTGQMLDGVERLGNRVPHPALMFFGLCILVLVLSWALALASISVTDEVAEAPPIPVEETYVGGWEQPVPQVPAEYTNQEPVIHTETTKIESLISIAGARFRSTRPATASGGSWWPGPCRASSASTPSPAPSTPIARADQRRRSYICSPPDVCRRTIITL